MLLKIQNKIEEVGNICTKLEEFCSIHNICEKKAYDIVIIVDEMATNIINYAFPNGTEHHFTIEVKVEDDYVHIQLVDDGIPFNPLQKSKPNLDESLDSRPIGGLGIYLVKQLSDFVTYSRISGKNYLDILINTTEEEVNNGN